MMNRTCQCGGIIREAGKPFWDTLPSCTCAAPVAIKQPEIRWATNTTGVESNPKKGDKR